MDTPSDQPTPTSTTSNRPRPLVIAHRGASAILPEHTLAGYAAAHVMGADMIEPDVVLSRDGVLICSHDLTLDSTTNVADIFPGRSRADGLHYVIDFTIEELRRLDKLGREGRVRMPGHRIATLDDMVTLVKDMNARSGRDVGIIPEAKHPAFHAQEGRPIESALIAALAGHGFVGPDDGCVIQCFDLDAIERMRTELASKLPMVWLLSEGTTDEDLRRAQNLCDGLGPNRKLLAVEHAGQWLPSAFCMEAQARGFKLYPYTFAGDQTMLRAFWHDIGVAGVFTDNTDAAVEAFRFNPAK